MKLIINASTLSGTGVTQVAVSFITECIEFKNNEYHVFMSPFIVSQLDITKFPINFHFYKINSHPLYGINGFFIRYKLRKLTKKISPDCVFSVFGPSWWTPKVPHLQGYAYPHYVYPDSPLFNKLSFKENIRITILKKIHCFFLKRNGKYFVCETEDVSRRLISLLNISKQNVFTVTNTCSSIYKNLIPSHHKLLPARAKNEFRFLSLCSFMKHKNLEILNQLIPLLKVRTKRNIKFVLTVDQILFEQKITLEARNSIINVGKIDIKECPYLYQECDALFLPTLLECFSANYPESMIMKRPILTSHLPFAKEVCGDAALYFDPMNIEDICDKILKIIDNNNLYASLVEKGEKRLSFFDSPQLRAEKYLDYCNKIAVL